MKTKLLAIILAANAHGADLKSIEVVGGKVLITASFGKDHKKYDLLHSTNLVENKWAKYAEMDWKHSVIYLPATNDVEFFKLKLSHGNEQGEQ